ncbi:MAG: HIT domain-containing protein [Chloroflexi bacterium]|nr:HIT domain-containing protein [Chloroflexota bacterium]
MQLKHLWTPWRMDYIGGKRKRERKDSCIFCQAAGQPDDDLTSHVIARSTHTFVMLNRYPYTYGHTMIIPYDHVASAEDLSGKTLTDLMQAANGVMRVLRAIAAPSGFNLGANIGEAAGAGIASHFHFHVVPRWAGDANFMVTVGGTQTMADTLPNAARKMRQQWERLKLQPGE